MYRDNLTKKSRGESAAKRKRRVEQRKKGRGTEGKARAERHTLRAARGVRGLIESGKSEAREPIDRARARCDVNRRECAERGIARDRSQPRSGAFDPARLGRAPPRPRKPGSVRGESKSGEYDRIVPPSRSFLARYDLSPRHAHAVAENNRLILELMPAKNGGS